MIQTALLQVDPVHPAMHAIERGASLIRAGELVVFPTETVYGLGADATQPSALERIFSAKGRPFSDPLIVHIADMHMLGQLVSEVPSQARQLASTFWPGPLTLVLPANERVPRIITAGLPTVAVRMPRHPVALALIRAANTPIAAPSANRFMHVSPTTAQHALADLDGRVPLILDAGPCDVGVESTVLSLCTRVPTILRPGGTSLEQLQQVLPNVQLASQEESSEEKTAYASPGQLPIHYAPHVPTFLYDGPVEAMRAAMLAEIRRKQAEQQQVGVLVANEDVTAFKESGAYVYAVGSESSPQQVATRLYAGLRVLEDASVSVILCRTFPQHGLGLAVRDRLLKAAGSNIISVHL
jgi:L-threonylcarbamoyladenylate synthase